MHIRTGFSIAFDTFGPTPMNLLLNVRPERRGDLLTPEVIAFDPPVAASQHVDAFGNVCTRIVAPGGRITMAADFTIADSGLPDDQAPGARQIAVQDLPDEVVPYLLGSRYCDTDKLSGIAWSLFGGTPEGWARVQAIVDFAHTRLRFDYQQADATRTAFDGYTQGVGVCRDFAHLAIALCRCMNIPARYATGYLGDIGVPKDPAPMDFSAWFEVFLEGPEGPRWYTFDARHNRPRIGRIVMARGRDATDCALTTSFGVAHLVRFDVHTDAVVEPPETLARAA
ncbi:Transglutaminase-like enzyme, putative cysteine protease [Methylobacterium sp. UNC300MFChir4.1]|uniref:transglutaminase-like domain-containing protein n=1 Tax=Methylobacterium sp. UNC300MFChir4.1 TaxID=1502747 RepID=UPI0008CF5977|nr:transglutaminase family protein [Methylobacterium sp. UNC300MFChir4.1]SEN51015.1 Transglutaminase-like enzyme, putative cysteine protease [Methylobacterium sp. UNC300MFChir4.1]